MENNNYCILMALADLGKGPSALGWSSGRLGLLDCLVPKDPKYLSGVK